MSQPGTDGQCINVDGIFKLEHQDYGNRIVLYFLLVIEEKLGITCHSRLRGCKCFARDGVLKVARSVGIVIRLESWKPIQDDKEEVKVKPGD